MGEGGMDNKQKAHQRPKVVTVGFHGVRDSMETSDETSRYRLEGSGRIIDEVMWFTVVRSITPQNMTAYV